jgi:hypothetical protein
MKERLGSGVTREDIPSDFCRREEKAAHCTNFKSIVPIELRLSKRSERIDGPWSSGERDNGSPIIRRNISNDHRIGTVESK